MKNFIIGFLVILLVFVYNFGDACIKKRDITIVKLNQTIETLESELEEKTNTLIDLDLEEGQLDFCPVCDEYVYIEETTTTSGDVIYYIECNKCQFSFGYYSSKSKLVNTWNGIDDN